MTCHAKTRTRPSRRLRSSMAATPATSRSSTPAISDNPSCRRRRLAGVLPKPQGRRARMRTKAARGPSWQRRLAAAGATANSSRRSTATGARSRRSSATGSEAKAQRQAASTLQRRDVQQATLDSVRALMMIRAYRMRGHLARRSRSARLEPCRATTELDPAHLRLHRGRSRPADLHRQRARPRVRDRSARWSTSCKRTYCETLGVEFMHISDPDQKAWIQERIEGPTRRSPSRREGKSAILNKLVEAEGFEQFLDVKYHRHQALRPRRRRSR